MKIIYSLWIKLLILLYGVIPAILIALFYLGKPYEDFLILKNTDPTILSILLNHYYHNSEKHLINNIQGYLLLISVNLAQLATLHRDYKWFKACLILVFVVFPIIGSIIYVYFSNSSFNTLGFSFINSELIGFIIAGTAKFYNKTVSGFKNQFFLFIYLSLSLLIYFFTYFEYIKKYLYLTIFPISLLFISIVFIKSNFIEIFQKLIEGDKNARIKFFMAFMFQLLFITLLPAIFPKVIVLNGHQINIYLHFVGLVFGLYLVYFTDIKLR